MKSPTEIARAVIGGAPRVTVRHVRKQAMISQQKMADDMGVGRVTVSRWENEHQGMHYRHRRKFCELFEVRPDTMRWPCEDDEDLY